MKLLVAISALCLVGCGTFNATVDGAQDVVNETVGAVGEGIAGITQAIGKDVSETVTFTTEGTASTVRKVTTLKDGE